MLKIMFFMHLMNRKFKWTAFIWNYKCLYSHFC